MKDSSTIYITKELWSYGAVTITKINKHPATGRPYSKVEITIQGREILKRL
mgnify:FL=1